MALAQLHPQRKGEIDMASMFRLASRANLTRPYPVRAGHSVLPRDCRPAYSYNLDMHKFIPT